MPPRQQRVTCFPVFGPIIAGKFQFSGMQSSERGALLDRLKLQLAGLEENVASAEAAVAADRRWLRLQRSTRISTPPSAAHFLKSHQLLVQKFVADRDRQKAAFDARG
jgi:hypothetical protein